jgi:ADP-heptose:LPS heptosyltransferase
MTDTSDAPLRILIIETLYLGDLIHTLPLIQAVRLRYPSARLDVLVRAAHVDLMQCVPEIDAVLAYHPSQHKRPQGLLRLCSRLRASRYDLVLNPGASDRATILTFLSGGKRRLGRLNRNQSNWLWSLMHDEVSQQIWAAEPMYWQKLRAFSTLLQLPQDVRFGINPPLLRRETLALPARYIHISPFASEDIRCLTPATTVALLCALRARHSGYGVVLSAGPSEREQSRLKLIGRCGVDLSGAVILPPCDLPTLSAVIAGATLHIGPDSGPLHLAVALGTPAVGCFLFKDASAEWMPTGPNYRCVGTTARLQGGLCDLQLSELLASVDALLMSNG